MSENTMRTVHLVSRSIDFEEKEFAERSVETMTKMAAERNLFVDLDSLRYVGEVDPPADIAGAEAVVNGEIGVHAFEAEAI